jgi:ankyrin repeat protein
LKEAHERIHELQKQLQESQQALLVHLASESLKPHRESHQEADDSCPVSPAEDARPTGALVEEVAPPLVVNMSCNVNVPELIRCAERGEEQAVEALLRNGEDPNSTDDMGLAALHGAAKKGRLNVVLLLLHFRANPNHIAAWRGETPLHYACKYGHEGIVRMLLLSKARPDVTSQDNKTPLQYAREKKHTSVENTIEDAIRRLARKA